MFTHQILSFNLSAKRVLQLDGGPCLQANSAKTQLKPVTSSVLSGRHSFPVEGGETRKTSSKMMKGQSHFSGLKAHVMQKQCLNMQFSWNELRFWVVNHAGLLHWSRLSKLYLKFILFKQDYTIIFI